MTAIKIPVYKPRLNGKEKEDGFAFYTGTKKAVAVSNGTVALHLALLALDIKEGDEVIVPTFTYIATVNAVKYVQAIPVFADCDRATWQIDCDDIEKKISPKTKAILITHLYGHPCAMVRLKRIADKAGLFLIEDCAEAIGSRIDTRHVGTFGHISTFSFYGNKTITTGEGGMVVSNDIGLLDKVFTFKMQGVSPVKQYWHEVIGYNYKMTNICAAIGLAQLEQIDELVRLKIQLAGWYASIFEKHGIDYHRAIGNITHSFWMFSILAESEERRNALRVHLEKAGIETRPTFYPVHTMPMYYKAGLKLPVSEDISCRGINLPSYPDLTQAEVTYIASSVIDFLSLPNSAQK
jgi:perosamine synthetase